MGIDGRQQLTICGPIEVLNQLQDTGLLALQNMDNECLNIANTFFGNNKLDLSERNTTILSYRYHFRNRPINHYFRKLLEAYPMCWIKNTYKTEDGDCGMWIGRTVKGVPWIQELEWSELSYEEEYNLEDFSL